MKTLYETDFVAWLDEQVKLLKKKDFQHLDLEHLIEEVQDLGAADKRAIMSHLIVVMMHMLKQRHQPEKNSKSWQDSIDASRAQIKLYMEEIPSLKRFPGEVYLKLYPKAIKAASKDMKASIAMGSCPWGINEILGD